MIVKCFGAKKVKDGAQYFVENIKNVSLSIIKMMKKTMMMN